MAKKRQGAAKIHCKGKENDMYRQYYGAIHKLRSIHLNGSGSGLRLRGFILKTKSGTTDPNFERAALAGEKRSPGLPKSAPSEKRW
jgi:hypothetical protein